MKDGVGREKNVSAMDWVLNLIVIFLSIVTVAFYNNDGFPRMASFVILAINTFTMIRARKNWYLFIISGIITYSNYSIVFANHLGSINTYFVSFSRERVASEGILVLLLFSSMFYVIMPHPKLRGQNPLIVQNRYNALFVCGLIVVLLLILVYGFGRPDVAGERGKPSTIYEYSIIIFILAVYYSGNNKFLYLILSAIMALFATQNFLYGGRVTGLQLIICWVLCFAIDRLTIRKAVPVALIGFILLSIIGDMRVSINFSPETILQAINRAKEKGGALDTAYSSYFTSLTFIKVKGMLGVDDRLVLLGRFLLSMILGGSAVPNSNLPSITREYFLHYYGGVLPYYGYFYLGVLGVLAITFYLWLWLRIMCSTSVFSKGIERCITIYITTTVFRWYLYGPSQLIRGVLLLVICFFVLERIDIELKREKRSYN